MKSILFTILLALCSNAFAAEQIAEWSVRYLADSTMSATDTKVVVHCFFNGHPTDSAKTSQIIYSTNGASNQMGVLSAMNEFMINEKAGKYRIQFYSSGYFQEITTDSIEIKPGIGTHIYLFFRYQDGNVEEVAKPVIYLYPETVMDISVDLKTIGELTFTYPQLNEGWNITAHPDGTLTYNGKNYPYLFWEADQQVQNPFELETFEGFIIAGKDAVSFLEEKLTQIGFNDRERTDFITFWGPKLVANEFNNVMFQFNETGDLYATLNIVPQPQNVNRVYMIWSKTNASALDKTITPQELPVLNRSGFDVLEWGGVEIMNIEL